GLAPISSMLFGKVGQDHTRLGQAAVTVLEHRHLAHLVEALAPFAGAGGAVHEIDEAHLERLVQRAQKEGGLEGVAGLAEAVESVHGQVQVNWRLLRIRPPESSSTATGRRERGPRTT